MHTVIYYYLGLKFEKCISENEYNTLVNLFKSKDKESNTFGINILDTKIRDYYTLGRMKKNKGWKAVKKGGWNVKVKVNARN